MRSRAHKFTRDWAGETREAAEGQTFWNEFLQIFGVSRRRVAVFEQAARRTSTGNAGWMDLFWPGYLAVEHKSAGANLERAMGQAIDYLPSLPQEHLPQLVVVSSFEKFLVRDLESGIETTFPLSELVEHLELFAFLAGYDTRHQFENEEDVNLAATDLLARLHDSLEDSGYNGHALRVFMTRLLFVLFADDTQVWERGLFHDYVTLKTHEDGRDLGGALGLFFQVLNTPDELRQRTLDEDLLRFSYINGGIFSEPLPIPACNREMRARLIACMKFNWGAISPAIFGSLFQNVMSPRERRALGAHYTSEQNILRTIRPLFLHQLEADLEGATTLPALKRFHERLGELTFFDPACGCGNFLVVAYRELRRIELECLRRIRARESRSDQMVLDTALVVRTHVGQFYGIEIEEFPAKIAETAMYLMDHLANRELSTEMGMYFVRFPISDTAHIYIGNALRTDWNQVLPSNKCSYLFGNPPFTGKKERSEAQRSDMQHVFGSSGGVGVLDYVCAWYKKATEYIGETGHTLCAFVSTNSITQGEQPPVLWSAVDLAKFPIFFAHRTFEWTSEAKGPAHVHCVIIGFSPAGRIAPSALFEYPTLRSAPTEKKPNQINGYLVDAPATLAKKRRQPLVSTAKTAREGSKLGDWKHLTIEPEQIEEVRQDSIAAKYLRPLIGAEEMLYGLQRWCFWLREANPVDLRNSPVLRERLSKLRERRSQSDKLSTRLMADRPAEFLETRQPLSDYLFIPCVSSSRRQYVPMQIYPATVVIRTPSFAVEGADLSIMGQLQSAMFMAWVRTVSGRLKSDFQIAPGTVYNTFPFAQPDDSKRTSIEEAMSSVLDVRSRYDGATLADLYDPLSMPGPLVAAHRELDSAVTAAFGRRRPKTDAERLELLFERYTALLSSDMLPLSTSQTTRRASRRRAS
ncbi:DNA methyltransferase [Micromonospora sp. NPDC005291]|uniref:DNA methyltransferase n=1 Tax=Micromonospora sp. NPDC005291 TaxID=3156872 RepID=UPI0033ABCEC6